MSKQLLHRTVTAGASALVTLSAMVAVPTASSAALTCSTATDWNPVLSSYTVNQGLGTYNPLVRGKTTVVRLFLTTPSCAVGATEQLVAGTLSAFHATTALGSAVSTVPQNLGPNYPAIDTSPTNNGTGNPIFQIPAFAGTDQTTGDFVATFTAHITYRYQAIPGGAWTTQTVDYPTSGSIQATVAPTPRPLRILVVPMGDASANPATQFPTKANGGTPINSEYADTVVQNGMSTLSRLLPVSDGVGDLTSATAGLRYTLDSQTMVDLGPNTLGDMDWAHGVAFCSKSDKFVAPQVTGSTTTQPDIAGQLATILSTWNSNNKTAQADRVVGVVWQGISQGVSDNGCDEGRAIINGNVAFVRLFADNMVSGTLGATQNPSESGALMGMEISHTWGAVPTSDTARSPAGDYHNDVATTADPSNTQRGYNTTLAQWMSSPLTVMGYSGKTSGYEYPSSGTASGWNDKTVLMEQPDYLFSQCALTPTIPTSDCPNFPVGTVTTAKAGGSFVLSGTTDGTQAGTFIHSYFDTVPQTTPSTNSGYYLVMTGPGGTTSTQVPVGFTESDHGSSPAVSVQLPIGVINAAIDAGDATKFALWKGQPPAGVTCEPANIAQYSSCLYARRLQTLPPAITSYNSGLSVSNLQDFTNAAGNETSSVLSPSGAFAAWVTSSGIVVQRRDPSTNKPAAGSLRSSALSGSDPAWSPDGTQLAFATPLGDIDTVTVTTSANPPTFANQQIVYNHLLQTPPPLASTAASHPTWSPDGNSLAAAINGDLWRFAAAASSSNPIICDLQQLTGTSTCTPLVTDGDDAAPAWGASGGTAGGGLIAYTHAGAIWTLDPNASSFNPTQRIANAGAPAWGAGLLAFVQNGNVLVANTGIEDGAHGWPNQTMLTTGGQDSGPSLSSNAGAISFTRNVGGTTALDVMDGTLADDTSGTITFTASTTGDPKNLEADLYITCGSSNRPIIVALKSSSTQSPGYTSNGTVYNTATFTTTYNEQMACPGGGIYVRVTDGFQISDPVLVRIVPGNPPRTTNPQLPRPAISAPRPGDIYLQYDAVVAIGSAISQAGATNPPGMSICWLLTGPARSGYSNTPVGGSCATNAEIDAPVPNGWVPGSYTLTEKVTDADGNSDAMSVTYTVLADPNHTGSNVGVTFNPQTLYVPSSGNDVTLTVKSQGPDLKVIDPKTVRISRVGSYPTAIPVDTASGTTGWVRNSDGTYTAKFNRQTLTCFISQVDLVGYYVPIVLTASGTGLTITGFDQSNPITSPSSTTVSC